VSLHESRRAPVGIPGLPPPPPPDKIARLKKKKWRILALRRAARYAHPGDETLPDLRSLRRVLLVALNFRLGNTIVATPGIAALVEALPGVEVDFLGGPSAPAVARGLGLRRVIGVRRADVYLPWRLLRLARSLRSQRYDAAVHVSFSTASAGAFLMRLSGARHRVGCMRGEGNVFFTSTVTPPWEGHKVDRMRAYMGLLGIPCEHERTMRVSEEEARDADARLAAQLGDARRDALAVFVGARASKGKHWDYEVIGAVIRAVRAAGLRPVVFLGPEEKREEREIRAAIGDAVYLEEPDLRRVAALVSRCRAVLTPDAGPMHLAIAVGAPTVALFRKPNHDRWGPRPPRGEVVFDPEGRDVAAAVAALRRQAHLDAQA
jgi:lipopolysaccharide heptosyltransferase III